MAIYTRNYLRRIAGTETMNESTRLFSQRDSKHDVFDIFLCHSYLDREEVKGMYLELTRKGYSVYVDWIVDPQLSRENVTKESAELIRKRLHTSKSLILAFSTNVALSKWVPWELGYVDGHTKKCALAPVAEVNQQSYERSEYLKLYPILAKEGGYVQDAYPIHVAESRNTYVDFSSWLRGASPVFQSKALF